MRVKCFAVTMILLLSLCSCSSEKSKEENIMKQTNTVNSAATVKPTYKMISPSMEALMPTDAGNKDTTFNGLRGAKETEAIKPLEQMQKIVLIFPKGASDRIETIGLDIKNKELYIHTRITEMDAFTPSATLNDSEIQQFLSVLRDEKVQEWKKSYGDEKEGHEIDSYCWTMILENEDGTVENHGGMGQDISACTPGNLDRVIDKIMNLKFVVDNQDKEPTLKRR